MPDHRRHRCPPRPAPEPWRIGAAGQKLEHAIAEIGEIGRAGAEIIILRRFDSPRSGASRAWRQAAAAESPSPIARRTGSISSSSSSRAIWNSRMRGGFFRGVRGESAASLAPRPPPKRPQAAPPPPRESRPGSRRSSARACSRIEPAARPGEATLPLKISSGRRSLIEIAFDQADQRIDGGCRVGSRRRGNAPSCPRAA